MHQSFPLVLAVDGGQSSTLAVAATLSGQILGAGLAGPSNHYHEPGGRERLESAIRDSTVRALQQAGGSADQVVHICLGMTGSIEEARSYAQQLYPHSGCESHVDMVTALAGASIAQPGIVVIAGTGSIAYGRLVDGRDARAGGWGYVIGDEGSAYQIGRAALQAASHAADRRGQPTLLLTMIPAHFGVSTFWEVRNGVYSPAIQKPQIAGLAAIVTEAARQGDSVSIALLDRAGRDLGNTAVAAMLQLDQVETGMNVYTTGGVFRAGTLIMDSLTATIRERSIHATVQEAHFSPVIGALFMALKAVTGTLTPAQIEAVRASLPRTAIEKHLQKEN